MLPKVTGWRPGRIRLIAMPGKAVGLTDAKIRGLLRICHVATYASTKP
jgi:hypothetical protein